MATRFWLSLSLTALMAGSAAAQDVQSVLRTAADGVPLTVEGGGSGESPC